MRLVECVPNFSEGRDLEKISRITGEIEATAGVKLLDVDPGASTNRTVVTFIGTPEAVGEAAFRAIRKAAEEIDMRAHKGAHSRIGATDVCPFVPVSGVTMDDCVRIARAVGERVARELGIPVYLYEAAAGRPDRRNLADIRAGEYEGLAEKMKDPRWLPDFGPPVFNPRSGATVVGAREFLIAYNINLNTRERRLANEIALSLRESGRIKKDREGNIVRDRAGRAIKLPGRFREVKAVGWYIEDYGIAQVSINFTNYKIAPVHAVFDEAVRLAQKLGLRVTGSELVGLIPKEALLAAGRHYLEKQGKSPGVPEEEVIRIAVRSLGLNDISPFDPQKKIMEYQFGETAKSLVDLGLREFANALSMDSPTPGGGSAAAVCGALSAALTAMVSNLTVGKKGHENVWNEMKQVAVRAQILKEDLLRAVDLDARAFDLVMAALRMPRGTPEHMEEKEKALEEASKAATLVPLDVLQKSVEVARLAGTAVRKGYKNSLSDAGVAALTARAAGLGAYFNIRINLQGIRDRDFGTRIGKKAESLRKRLEASAGSAGKLLEKTLGRSQGQE
ncbi:MAG: glutamate formimidoyltransferase [Acidobacteriota bacterium]|nr:glutamate formimidoyltransferase [Acidobacteriota bacterium]